ncbi:acetyl-CoA C-acyltransferase [Accumulibacter sp.]|uniref:acetyl-CoA C-acyltransferase n=1 Tax=Accumulibacter sp. TaxID=2053492 RepID=UPI0025D45A5E|nr:acetyl-CoA C-acyltransferase [Accumulibacter sp.]MCP5229242.1 acetyl-CoA C-acyltransferase [Accumulibacter sp.]
MSKQIQEAYIVAATRLPVGRRKGMLGQVRPDDMLAHAIASVMAQVPAIDPALVEDVIVGCAMPEAEQGMNVARIGLLLAGMPNSVPGVTVNRFCASGVQAVAMAADRIRLGEAGVMIAAGTETMSLMNQIMGNKIALNPALFEKEENYTIAFGMGITAEKVAAQWKISREDQDAFAVASHQKACAAISAGHFKAEISPYEVTARIPDLRTGEVAVTRHLAENDEGPRADSSVERLARLRPVFAARGSVTAGNSSQMSDGAAAVLVVSEKVLKQFNLQPLARFAGFSVAGVAPEIMGIGPVEAIPRVLKLAGVRQDEVDWFELNEAFAAQALAVMRTLDLDPAKVNPLGGAIALGHPLGATGTVRTATLVHGLRRTRQRYGMVTMCIGTGMGAAGLFESMQ